jgi:hypothetical protein
MSAPSPDTSDAEWGPLIPRLALGLLVLATLIGFLVYPTYPNYDSYYSLLWGRELLDFTKPSFDTYYAPTQHPLAVFFGAGLSVFGRGADRIMVFCTLVSFVLLTVGIYRFARLLFTPAVGLVAGAILCTRFDFPFLAARAYIDIPYLALVVWAVVLEIQRPGRGGWVWVLLLCAGLLRPEAWLLLGVYGLWLAVRAWRQTSSVASGVRTLLRSAAISAIAPAIWLGFDAWVTGDPLFSLTHTTAFAEELGRTKGVSEIPHAMRSFFFNLTKAPVLGAGILGAALAFWFVPRRALLPATLWLIGSGTFVLVGIAGLSVIDRYLLVPALMVMVFAAVTIAGWSLLKPSMTRKVWLVVSVLAVLYGAVFTVTRVNFNQLTSELTRRGESHRALVELLDRPELKESCRPFSVPNHKLVPEVRWVANLGEPDVVPRTQALGASDRTLKAADRAQRQRAAKRLRGDGTALYVADRGTINTQAIVSDRDDTFNNLPVYVDGVEVPGFNRRLAFNDFYSAYDRCPAR